MGFGIQFVERIADIKGNVGVTAEWNNTCVTWENYYVQQHPEQDDSGL